MKDGLNTVHDETEAGPEQRQQHNPFLVFLTTIFISETGNECIIRVLSR